MNSMEWSTTTLATILISLDDDKGMHEFVSIDRRSELGKFSPPSSRHSAGRTGVFQFNADVPLVLFAESNSAELIPPRVFASVHRSLAIPGTRGPIGNI